MANLWKGLMYQAETLVSSITFWAGKRTMESLTDASVIVESRWAFTLPAKDLRTSMTVSRADLERYLDRLASRTQNPSYGLFGPESMLWKLNRESIIFLGGGRAALLQTAHPFVAHGVDQHSKTKTDPQGRFRRTFANVFAMVFGDLSGATKSARRVHAIHDRITGLITERIGAFDLNSPYEANKEEALLWVHATLWDTSILVYEHIFGPLPLPVKDRYYEETKLFAYLFGIPDSVLPPNWTEFMEYNQKMWESDVLAVGRPASEIAHFILQAPRPELKPVFAWYKIITAALLPERIRHQFNIGYGRAEKAVFDASLRAIRTVYPKVPERLRYLPAYNEAQRRIEGKEGKDLFGKIVEKSVLLGLKRREPQAA